MSVAQCIPSVPFASDPAIRVTVGAHLSAGLRRFAAGEESAEETGDLFEEVGAVIAGAFHIIAAGENYHLSAGEAIIIPPGEPRRWRCTQAPGLLYRVHAREDAAA